MRPDLVVDLPISVDRADPRPLPVQIAAGVRELIASGVLSGGDHLPATRPLAVQLGVARGTVVAAYDELAAEGHLVADHGSGSVVRPSPTTAPSPTTVVAGDRSGAASATGRDDATPPPPRTTWPRSPSPRARSPRGLPGSTALVDLPPGRPDTSTLADPHWRSAWRRAAARPCGPVTDPLGDPSLRDRIADHLRLMRGVVADPARIVVTAGAREGLASVLEALATDPSHPRPLSVGVESPGYPSLRKVPAALGHRTVDLPTDASGIDTSALPTGHLDAALVTPSHQYPHGGSLPGTRRVELAGWAARTGCLLVEDDHDSELRHVGTPLPALTTVAARDTVLLGTFSALLGPGLSCGYLLAPARLVDPLRRRRAALGQPVSAIVQTALADYLASGQLRRHTQRMRRVYRRRRQLVVDRLGHLSHGQLLPLEGGLHAVLVCRDEEAVVAGCAARGVAVTALSSYWGGAGARRGVVVGFGSHDDATLARALDVIAEVVG